MLLFQLATDSDLPGSIEQGMETKKRTTVSFDAKLVLHNLQTKARQGWLYIDSVLIIFFMRLVFVEGFHVSPLPLTTRP